LPRPITDRKGRARDFLLMMTLCSIPRLPASARRAMERWPKCSDFPPRSAGPSRQIPTS